MRKRRSTGASEAESRGNTHDVTGTDTGRGRDHQSTKGRSRSQIDRLLRYDADRLTEQADLDQAETDGEVQTRQYKNQGYDVRLVQNSADRIDNIINGVNHTFSFLQIKMNLRSLAKFEFIILIF